MTTSSGSRWQPVDAAALVRCGACGVEPLYHLGRRLVVVTGDAAGGYYADTRHRHECMAPTGANERTHPMTSNDLAVRPATAALAPAEPLSANVMDAYLGKGDLSGLTPAQRAAAYRAAAESMGLNWLARPFDLLETRDKRLQLYPNAAAAQQLRERHGVSIRIVGRELLPGGEVYVVTARATDRQGREDEAIGAVYAKDVRGQPLADLLMKAEQKAKRRVTLSICGLGWAGEVDESWQQPIQYDAATGEVLEQTPEPLREPMSAGGATAATEHTAAPPPAAAPTADDDTVVIAPAPAPALLTDLVAQYRMLTNRCGGQGIPAEEVRELSGRVTRALLEPEIGRLTGLLEAL